MTRDVCTSGDITWNKMAVSVNDISYFRRFNRKVPNGVKQEIEERDGFGGACGSQKETSNGIKDGPSHNCSHLYRVA